MAWGDNTKGPWGQPPGGKKPSDSDKQAGSSRGDGEKGGGKKIIDIDNLFRNSKSPNEFKINTSVIIVLILLGIVGWALTGFYMVDASEEGIILRFGKYHRTAPEGLRYHLPSPIEKVYIVKKTIINSIQIGFRSNISQPSSRFSQRPAPRSTDEKMLRESLMITGDTNIADVSFVVQWRIKNSFNYLFKVSDPENTMENTIKAVAESAMREIIGRSLFAEAMTTKRSHIENEVKDIIQSVLDSYEAGVEIYTVNLNDVQNPQPVMAAFLDVETAKQDKETTINRAKAYEYEVIPRARGETQKIVQQAEAYKEEVISIAKGEAQRFASVYNEYAKAKDVTRKRIYLETMQKIMAGTDKIIIDDGAGKNMVPYLPLNELKKGKVSTEERIPNEEIAP